MNRRNTFYYGVDPNEIDQVNGVRARSAGGVPGRRHNLMVSKNRDIINGLFFYSSYAFFHIHIFRNNCQSHEYQSNSSYGKIDSLDFSHQYIILKNLHY
jgi:hypothetical protein